MTEEDYGPSFQIIAEAGDSKACSMNAIKAARAGDFEAAKAQLKEAGQRLLKAHRYQTDMIAREAEGNQVPVNIILVHSQDHLTMAMVAEDLAQQFFDLYEQLHQVKKELNELKQL
ncbi:PTS lactose/cellobiose transporter subunit IIA [Lachnospiraceae bacterium 54-53]